MKNICKDYKFEFFIEKLENLIDFEKLENSIKDEEIINKDVKDEEIINKDEKDEEILEKDEKDVEKIQEFKIQRLNKYINSFNSITSKEEVFKILLEKSFINFAKSKKYPNYII
jgi:hypothetical protein